MHEHAINEQRTADEIGTGLFDSIVVGVDVTPESLEAVRQANRLREATGRLLLVTASDRALALQAGWAGTSVAGALEQEARAALSEAARLVSGADSRLVVGEPVSVLLRTAEEDQASLIALGTHGVARMAGIALGFVGTTVLHDARCSVLFARRPVLGGSFPRAIAAGIDGSRESLAAARLARRLATRFDSPARFILSSEGDVDAEAAGAAVPELVVKRRPAVEALCATGEDVDLLVVGSRGLHGLRALGSVSERVAHRAPCSVLVVRTPPPA